MSLKLSVRCCRRNVMLRVGPTSREFGIQMM